MHTHNINKEEMIDYLKNTGNNRFDKLNNLYMHKTLLARILKRNPDIGKRYIKKLYTSL